MAICAPCEHPEIESLTDMWELFPIMDAAIAAKKEARDFVWRFNGETVRISKAELAANADVAGILGARLREAGLRTMT